jgi:hypothetical protein
VKGAENAHAFNYQICMPVISCIQLGSVGAFILKYSSFQYVTYLARVTQLTKINQYKQLSSFKV